MVCKVHCDLGAQQRPATCEKGTRKDGACNVTACQQPPAIHFNVVTRAWYCHSCAMKIRESGLKDGHDLFPSFEEECREVRESRRAELGA